LTTEYSTGNNKFALVRMRASAGGSGKKKSAKQARRRMLFVHEVVTTSKFYGQATKGVRVDALAQSGEEGRGQLR
jgi:hypothetical protein